MEANFFDNPHISTLLNSLQDAVFIGNAQGILRANQQALQLVGLPSQEALPTDLPAFIDAFDFRYLESEKPVIPGQGPLSLALNGQSTVTELSHINSQTGKRHYCRCSASPLLEGERVVAGLLVVTDITERILAEKKLHETLHALSFSTKEQEAILNSMPDGVFIGNSEGIYKVNRPGLDMFGCRSLSDMRGRIEQLVERLNVRSAATGEPSVQNQDPFSKALDGESVVEEIIITNLNTRQDLYLRCAAAPVYVGSKNIGVIAVTTDITQKVLAEQKLQRTLQELRKVNEELEAFTYAVSHDLKSPLGRISGLASLLLISNESQISDKDRYLLQLIVQSSEKLTELVSHLLKLGKIGQTELNYSKIDLSRLCEQVIENLPVQGKKVHFVIEPNMQVWGDKTLMHSVMQNLIANAVKYSSRTAAPEVRIGSHEARGYTTCYVRDNGVGFDMSEADKLFVPFKRLYSGTNFEGTGVGLSTVKRIIERHEGKIWAESSPGEGAIFYFTLPGRKKLSSLSNNAVKLQEETATSKSGKLSA
ncbi:sensor histidine kinase [Cesiribacter andamanensis]|uniref:sensor histidine kinase n=1 Tax=Cesiribacter andamanensis TaxID=649507 RepID=UPI000688B83F|nr:ATP-binding protein [Cesiribacter andamanensis]